MICSFTEQENIHSQSSNLTGWMRKHFQMCSFREAETRVNENHKTALLLEIEYKSQGNVRCFAIFSYDIKTLRLCTYSLSVISGKQFRLIKSGLKATGE